MTIERADPHSPCWKVLTNPGEQAVLDQRFIDLCGDCLGLLPDAAEKHHAILKQLPKDAMFVEKCSVEHATFRRETDTSLFIVEGIPLDSQGRLVVLAQKIPQHTALK